MRTRSSDQRGIALIMVMLITVAVSALVAGAILLTSTSRKIAGGQEREEEMRNAADAGIELGRSALNGGAVTMPDTGYAVYQLNQPVYDANSVQIPNVTRSIYYGPTGSSTGQYGVFGSVVSVITDPSGAVVVRRGELAQESFAKFAYYTDNEGTNICFGNMDNIFGPLHTNDDMCIYSSGARFRSTVEVSGVITGLAYGIFDLGAPTQNGSLVPMPTLADLVKLNTYATAGGMSYTVPAGGTYTSGQARMRIEFLALDLDNDGRVTGPSEGFYRVYTDSGALHATHVVAARTSPANESRNCGHWHGGVFYTANKHRYGAGNAPGHTGTAPPSTGAGNEAMSAGSFRCWLGGDEHLFVTAAAGFPSPRNTFVPADSFGQWVLYTNTPDPAVVAALANAASNIVDTNLVNRQVLAQYLIPMSRSYNPNTKGVIYVDGRVALSGTLNSRLTIASTDNIILADDLRYAVASGSAPCAGSNMLGLLSPDTIWAADNSINAPWDYLSGTNAIGGGGTIRTYDDSPDEFFNAVVLTLRSFAAENWNSGATLTQPCQGSPIGRGCLFLTGGIIQQVRGIVAVYVSGGGRGYLKRYAYDACAAQTPPPYFPTTGRYMRNRYYEIDPVGFNIAAFFLSLAPQ